MQPITIHDTWIDWDMFRLLYTNNEYRAFFKACRNVARKMDRGSEKKNQQQQLHEIRIAYEMYACRKYHTLCHAIATKLLLKTL